MTKTVKTVRCKSGFSLAEVIATLTIGSMLLVVVFNLYTRASKSAQAVMKNMTRSDNASDILQQIAEDLDTIVAADSSETTLSIHNKYEEGYPTARMVIEQKFYNSENELQTFSKITWLSSYDFESSVPGLVIYRSHSGMDVEDKLLDKQKQDWERELFIPLCEGVTFFRIEAISGNETYDKWETQELPHAVVVTLSFAEPFETLQGTLDVFDEDKTSRTVAIDRTRRMGFSFVTQYDLDIPEANDVNQTQGAVQDRNDVNDVSPMNATEP